MADLPSVSGTYRLDFDFLSAGPYCDGTDVVFNDSVEIQSDGHSVTFRFQNETDDPILPRYQPILFEPRKGVFYRDCDANILLSQCLEVSAAPYKDLLIGVLDCALSLEGDPAKKAALQQIRSLIELSGTR